MSMMEMRNLSYWRFWWDSSSINILRSSRSSVVSFGWVLSKPTLPKITDGYESQLTLAVHDPNHSLIQRTPATYTQFTMRRRSRLVNAIVEW